MFHLVRATADRMLAALVPDARAAAADCGYEYWCSGADMQGPGDRYRRWCCYYASGAKSCGEWYWYSHC